VSTLNLSRLGRREAAALAGSVAGNNVLPEEIVEEIIERTDGIPLFVEELTKAVVEARIRDGDEASTLDRVPPSALAVPATLHASLPLVRDVAYGRLLRGQRQQLHGRIADVLAERFPTTVEAEPEVIAHHYREAGMADAAKGGGTCLCLRLRSRCRGERQQPNRRASDSTSVFYNRYRQLRICIPDCRGFSKQHCPGHSGSRSSGARCDPRATRRKGVCPDCHRSCLEDKTFLVHRDAK
jgi:hypothetical protein